MPVAPVYLLDHLLLLFPSFGVAVMCVYIYIYYNRSKRHCNDVVLQRGSGVTPGRRSCHRGCVVATEGTIQVRTSHLAMHCKISNETLFMDRVHPSMVHSHPNVQRYGVPNGIAISNKAPKVQCKLRLLVRFYVSMSNM
jgi:hypothetical protein